MKTKGVVFSALFIALFFVSGLIKIYVLSIPFTLQTMAVMLAACFLGLKKSFLAILVYILTGLIGIPVFTKGGGPQYVLEPTFGYILGFIPAAVFIGMFKEKAAKKYLTLAFLLFVSGIIMLLCGALYSYLLLSLTTGIRDLHSFICGYFAVFIPAELIKALASALVYLRIKKYISSLDFP